jgi:F-type H+-transporting ATPase subunit delta
MKISKQARREAKHLFRTCMVDGRLDEGRVREAVRQVVAKKPRGYLAVLAQFQRLVKLEEARRTTKVESAAPLPGDLRASVESNLLRRYGPGLRVSFVENPALIGGLRIQVGSDVFDGTIQARLNRLQESF